MRIGIHFEIHKIDIRWNNNDTNNTDIDVDVNISSFANRIGLSSLWNINLVK